MHIVIDGYNVLKQIIQAPIITEKQRQAFFIQLMCYAKIKNHKITLVFDGGPGVWPDKEKINNDVTVIYVGHNSSADDYIVKNLLNEREMIVVSSDLQIKKEAAKFDILSLDSKEFYALLLQTLKKKPTVAKKEVAIKTSSEKNEFVDELMTTDEQLIQKKENNEEPYSRQSKQYTASKKERQILKKIKKL